MADVTKVLKAEIGVKADKSDLLHHQQHHLHEKIIAPTTLVHKEDLTKQLQSQLHQGKEVEKTIETKPSDP